MLKSKATTNFKAKFPLNHQISDDFSFMEKHLNYQCLNPQIEYLKNINVSNNCVIFKNFKINANSCITSNIYQNYCRNYKFF
ncbi:MAG: hypothetical protein ACKO47_05655, partial [Alphaproteobacteria bacterium]